MLTIYYPADSKSVEWILSEWIDQTVGTNGVIPQMTDRERIGRAERMMREHGDYVTFDDIIVRRVLRGVASGELDPAELLIRFVDGRKMETIKVDDSGRIYNWPAGFMDEDLKESQRLIDSMCSVEFDLSDDYEE